MRSRLPRTFEPADFNSAGYLAATAMIKTRPNAAAAWEREGRVKVGNLNLGPTG